MNTATRINFTEPGKKCTEPDQTKKSPQKYYLLRRKIALLGTKAMGTGKSGSGAVVSRLVFCSDTAVRFLLKA